MRTADGLFVMTDFDGTIADIVNDHEKAEIRERALPDEAHGDLATDDDGVDQQPRAARDAWPDARPRADPERIREALGAEGEDWLLRLYEQFVDADRR